MFHHKEVAAAVLRQHLEICSADPDRMVLSKPVLPTGKANRLCRGWSVVLPD
jgi:hypothetical protein